MRRGAYIYVLVRRTLSSDDVFQETAARYRAVEPSSGSNVILRRARPGLAGLGIHMCAGAVCICADTARVCAGAVYIRADTRKVDNRLPGKGNSNSHCARQVY